MDNSWLISNIDNNKENKSGKANPNISIGALISSSSIQNDNHPSNPNISFTSYGILTQLNTNIQNATLNTINDSFECDKIKLDVYEQSIQKLADENKALRKRIKKITELARQKEEQLIDAYNEACEDKNKFEEKNQIQHK
jgi:hypothetical protein